MTDRFDHITLLLLAGGRGRRLDGRDKGLEMVAGRPLIRYLLDRFSPFFQHVIISANRNIPAYEALCHKVVTDADQDYKGPLAGMQSALSQIATPWMLTLPCDMPLLPVELIGRLWRAVEHSGRPAAIAHDGTQVQPLCNLLSARLADTLRADIAAGHRRCREWLLAQDPVIVDCSDCAELFANINNDSNIQNIIPLLTDRR